MKTVVCLLACWLAMLVCAAAEQQAPPPQPPTFRTGVDVVQIDASAGHQRLSRAVPGSGAKDVRFSVR